MSKTARIFFLLFLVLLLSGCGMEEGTVSYDLTTEYETSSLSDGGEEQPENLVYVSVSGYVNTPGVFVMPKGSRVYEAINAAGGVSDQGDTSHINLVNIIQDGATIYVPRLINEDGCNPYEIGESDGLQRSPGNDGLVNINTANINELTALAGIGNKKAEAIIAYRERVGSFEKIEDIMNVSGIKEGTFEAVKDKITVY